MLLLYLRHLVTSARSKPSKTKSLFQFGVSAAALSSACILYDEGHGTLEVTGVLCATISEVSSSVRAVSDIFDVIRSEPLLLQLISIYNSGADKAAQLVDRY